MQTLAARFWSKVSMSADGCWQWTGSTDGKGYGQLWIDGRKYQAHVVSFVVIHSGAIGNGLQLDHLCFNKRCVRPDHLEPVTARENSRRRSHRNPYIQRKREQTHCVNGHPFDGENLAMRGPTRVCR